MMNQQELNSHIMNAIGSLVDQEVKDENLKLMNSLFDNDNGVNYEDRRSCPELPREYHPPPAPPAPQPQENNELNKVLFILFILNHYRNPDVLFNIFFDIVPAQHYRSPNYQQLRNQNIDAFVHICQYALRMDILPNILPFLEKYKMNECFLGVFDFCSRNLPIVIESLTGSGNMLAAATATAALRAVQDSAVNPSISSIRSNNPNTVAFTEVFNSFKDFCENLARINFDALHLPGGVVDRNLSPSDLLLHACSHLKEILTHHQAELCVNMLKDACNLFPQCYDVTDPYWLFSYFQPCLSYQQHSLLSDQNFQKALGCFAFAKNKFSNYIVDYTNRVQDTVRTLNEMVHDVYSIGGKRTHVLSLCGSFLFKMEYQFLDSIRPSTFPGPFLGQGTKRLTVDSDYSSDNDSDDDVNNVDGDPFIFLRGKRRDQHARLVGASQEEFDGGSYTQRRHKLHRNNLSRKYKNKHKRTLINTKYTIKRRKNRHSNRK
jgi:hypothetical protein